MSSWRDRDLGGVGVVSLVALLTVTLLAGCGSSSSGQAGSAGAATATATPSGGSTQGASLAVGGHLLRRFSGSGNTHLGTIVVSSPAVLVWRAQHPAIQIFTARGFMLVSSSAPSGSVRLSRGTYPGMRVATRAGWSIELRARS